MVVLVFVCVCAVAPRQCTSQFEIVVHVRVSLSGGIRGAPGRTGQLGPKRVLERTITGPNRRQGFPYPKEYQHKSSTLRLALQSGFDRESTPKSSARIGTILVLVLQPYSPAVSYQRTAVS